MKTLKALVTGATGFIGSHLVEALLKKGYDVSCTVRKTSDVAWLKSLPVQLIEGDITDRDSMIPAVKNMDYIFHLGGVTKAKNEALYYKVNADGARILYEVCNEFNPQVRKIVHVSSLAAAGPAEIGRPRIESDLENPITDYGKSKREGEKYALQYSRHLPITIIRPPAVYGPREQDLLIYFRLVHRHWRPILGLKARYVSMIYSQDLVDAIILAAERSAGAGQIYFVDDGKIYTWTHISLNIQGAMRTWTLPLFVPESLTVILGYLFEFFSKFSPKHAILNRQKIIEIRQRAWTCSSEKIRKELGFQHQFDLTAGCDETVKWYRQNGWL